MTLIVIKGHSSRSNMFSSTVGESEDSQVVNLSIFDRFISGLAKEISNESKIELEGSVKDIYFEILNSNLRRRNICVVGNVQSGKTNNIIGLTCKLVDDKSFTDIIIILTGTSGVKSTLYSQTYKRFKKTFEIKNSIPYDFKIFPSDFDLNPEKRPREYYSINTEELKNSIRRNDSFIFVAMKDSTHLKYLSNEIQIVLRKCVEYGKSNVRLTIIDDECDDQSVGNSNNSKVENTIHNKINYLIECLSEEFSFINRIYVGYTATSAAKQLESLESDLKIEKYHVLRYPSVKSFSNSDISYVVKKINDSYIGGDYFYEENLTIDSDEFGDDISSLKSSLLYYAVACVIAKLDNRLNDKKFQMIINFDAEIEEHRKCKEDVAQIIIDIENELSNAISMKQDFMHEYKEVLENYVNHNILLSLDEIESSIFISNVNILLGDFAGFVFMVKQIFMNLDLILVNSGSAYVLNGEEKYNIYIGGNVMSRGVTFERLVTSFFKRSPNNDDTLSQMQRWFGYRGSYLQYCRLLTSHETKLRFANAHDTTKKELVSIKHGAGYNKVELGSHPNPTGKIRTKQKLHNSIMFIDRLRLESSGDLSDLLAKDKSILTKQEFLLLTNKFVLDDSLLVNFLSMDKIYVIVIGHNNSRPKGRFGYHVTSKGANTSDDIFATMQTILAVFYVEQNELIEIGLKNLSESALYVENEENNKYND